MNGPHFTIGGLAPWFGSKRTLGPRIAAEMGPHTAFWDLFTGSMSVLLAKEPSRMEVVNDFHGDLINLARVIQHATLGPKLYRWLRRVLASEAEFRAALAVIRSAEPPATDAPLDLDRAFSYFVASWQGMNGVAGTSSFNTNFARRFSSKGGDQGARWSGVVRSIPGWRRRMERVQILRSCGIALARKIEDRGGTVIYADPPYLVKGAKYLHDFTPDHHRELAEALGWFRETRVVLSYYDHPDLATLYPSWRVVTLRATKALLNQGKRDQTGATAAPEVLLCNFPALESRHLAETAELLASNGVDDDGKLEDRLDDAHVQPLVGL